MNARPFRPFRSTPSANPSRALCAALAALLLAAMPARATTFVKEVMVIGHPETPPPGAAA